MLFHVGGWRDTILPLQRHKHSPLHAHHRLGDVSQAARFKRCFDALPKLLIPINEALPEAQILNFDLEPHQAQQLAGR